MDRLRHIFLLPSAIVLVWSLPAVAQSDAGDQEISDEVVKKAIDKGMHRLLEAQNADGSWEPYMSRFEVGPSAIAAYALLEGGASTENPKIKLALEWLASHDTNFTYELGLRCNVWLLADAKASKYRANLEKDMQALIDLCVNGGYSYGGGTRAPVPIKGKVGPGNTKPGSVPGWMNVRGYGDNSNSQYGLLGVWAAARDERIEDIPQTYWQMVLNHWLNGQGQDGGWGYSPSARGGGASGTMTCAGIASVLVCEDNLNSDDYLHCKVGQSAAEKSARAGLDWLEKSFNNAGRSGMGGAGYYLYGVERVGLASGMKCFGSIDWYNTLCKVVLAGQDQDGAWGGGGRAFRPPRRPGPGGAAEEPEPEPNPKSLSGPAVVETAYHLLFLIRGHAPVLFNKLQFSSLEGGNPVESDWNCRARDLAHLCAWLGRNYEQTFNWQIVNFKTPVSQWHDAPILCISGARKPDFTPEQIEALRTFVYQGGTIFSCTECDGQEFKEGIRRAYARIFPQYELVSLNADHDIYTRKVAEALNSRPKIQMITNNVRPLVLHVDEDLPLAWQAGQVKTRLECFQAMANLVMYVTDKGVLRARASCAWPAEFKFAPDADDPGAAEPPQTDPPAPPTDAWGRPRPIRRIVRYPIDRPSAPPRARGSVKIVRLKWNGNWNPEPLALERFSRMFARQTHIRMTVLEPIEIPQVEDSGAAVAILGGQGRFKAGPEQMEALRKYVQDGGTLVVSAAGGDATFAQDAQDAMQTLIPGQRVQTLGNRHGIYNISCLPDGKLATGKESDNPMRYRRGTLARLGEDEARNLRLRGVTVGKGSDQRAAVIFSREDLTDAGLVGYYSYTVDGYDPGEGEKGSAYRLMRNIVVYAMDAQGRVSTEKPEEAIKPADHVGTGT